MLAEQFQKHFLDDVFRIVLSADIGNGKTVQIICKLLE